MHVSTAAVKAALELASISMPKGEISDGPHAVTIAANDQLLKAADYRNVIVSRRDGALFKLQDVAAIFDSTINDERAGWFDDERGVVLYVLKNADANVVQTVDDDYETAAAVRAMDRRPRSRCTCSTIARC